MLQKYNLYPEISQQRICHKTLFIKPKKIHKASQARLFAGGIAESQFSVTEAQ